jgi:rhodanese-related sulfurtransferase
LRKASEHEAKEETKHDVVVDQNELAGKMNDTALTILDVREPAEFAFGHIPGAVNIPLGELESRFPEIDRDKEIHVICRTGSRSDLAAQKLAAKGFANVKNVIPGMIKWEGPLEKK